MPLPVSRLILGLCGVVSILSLAGCPNDDDDAAAATPPAADGPMQMMSLSFTDLPDVGSNFRYEGWLITPGGAVTTGLFQSNGTGTITPSTFLVPASAASSATKFVLTIEPAVDTNPAPSDVHILAGDLSGTTMRTAALTTADGAALNTDFSAANGSYILAAPTLPMGTDYTQGLWFLTGSTPNPSLTLPTLPAGWVYEGWVIKAGVKYSTGTFTSTSGDDSNNVDSAPPFPGQDYDFSLIGAQVAISVEPVPDTGADPFPIIPLMDGDVTMTAEGADQELATEPPPLPVGAVTVGAISG